MKNLLIIIFVLFVSQKTFSQATDSIDCPKIKIEAPRNNEVSLNTKTSLYITKIKVDKEIQKNLSYNWSVYNGALSDKGISKNVQVTATGQIGQKMIVALKITGLNEACPSTASIQLEIIPELRTRVETKLVGVPARGY